MRLLLEAVLCCAFLVPSVTGQTKSSLESDPGGWIDLLADTSMRDWIRGPLGANRFVRAGQMSDPSPWKLDPAGKILLCEGDRVGHEWLRYAPELSDFILHAEYRFAPVPGETRYNAGVFVRTGADGKVWHQAQATLEGGYLFGNTTVSGTMQMVNLREKMSENRVKPAGEWNVYEIRAVGKHITLWVNGAVVNEFPDCEVTRGFLGLEAEGYRVEFRNVQLKRLPIR
jgi:hypothetical protein